MDAILHKINTDKILCFTTSKVCVAYMSERVTCFEICTTKPNFQLQKRQTLWSYNGRKKNVATLNQHSAQ